MNMYPYNSITEAVNIEIDKLTPAIAEKKNILNDMNANIFIFKISI